MNRTEDDSGLIVHKYGGSSVASPEKVREVARRVVRARRSGVSMVVVVSAMGKTTNQLLGLARDVTRSPCPRELDMLLSSGERISASLLSMALKEEGIDAISLSGSQAGIVTDDTHSNATVLEVHPDRIREEVAQDRVVVVAGYQGANRRGEVTTLGRGGSDTSAVAFASALGARECQICSDVDGVYTADPRIVPAARRLAELSYDEMLEMSRAGAQVLNPKAVDLARRSRTPILARASFSDDGGTRIHETAGGGRAGIPKSVAGYRSVVRVVGGKGLGANARLGIATALEDYDVLFGNVESPTIEFVVSTKNIADPSGFAASLRERFADVEVLEGLGTASVIGLGVGADRAVDQRANRALVEASLSCPSYFGSPHALTFVLPAERVPEAQRILHQELLGGTAEEGNPATDGAAEQTLRAS